eukprot:14896582-Heterocapsa_arctica.AAC.1
MRLNNGKPQLTSKGWQGVWEPAIVTENNNDGVTGRSGGVAILTWNGTLFLKSDFEADHKLVGATIGWGRKKSIHIFSVYGYDTAQTYKQGQSYYERGNRTIRYTLGRCLA